MPINISLYHIFDICGTYAILCVHAITFAFKSTYLSLSSYCPLLSVNDHWCVPPSKRPGMWLDFLPDKLTHPRREPGFAPSRLWHLPYNSESDLFNVARLIFLPWQCVTDRWPYQWDEGYIVKMSVRYPHCNHDPFRWVCVLWRERWTIHPHSSRPYNEVQTSLSWPVCLMHPKWRICGLRTSLIAHKRHMLHAAWTSATPAMKPAIWKPALWR